MEQSYTGRIACLRPLEDDDLDLIASLYRSTPNYRTALPFGHASISTLRLRAELDDAQQRDSRFLFAIERCSDHAVIGMADVELESTMSEAATISLLLIGGPYQGQGYGNDAAELLETALFSDPTVDLILAGVDEASKQGIRFWQKRGYTFSGRTTHDPATSRTTVWLAKRRGGSAAGE